MIFTRWNHYEITKTLAKIRRGEPPWTPQRSILRSSIMGYELGRVQEFACKNAQENLPKEIKKGFEEEAKLGMADLITQLRMFCLDHGWSFNEIQILGAEHLIERTKDFKKDGYAEAK